MSILPVKILPQNRVNVKGFNGVSPGGKDRATLESDLSVLPARQGMHRFFVP